MAKAFDASASEVADYVCGPVCPVEHVITGMPPSAGAEKAGQQHREHQAADMPGRLARLTRGLHAVHAASSARKRAPGTRRVGTVRAKMARCCAWSTRWGSRWRCRLRGPIAMRTRSLGEPVAVCGLGRVAPAGGAS